MIEEIRIRGLGVIDDAVVEPHAGFTALTGETGAGKTLVLSGLGLLLGGRADAGVVRPGTAKAEVEGRFRVREQRVVDRVVDAGGDLDDGSLVIARTVAGEGRSRAFLGGRSVPASVLLELADDLVAVHGQSDQQRLLAPARQRAALDRFAGDAVLVPRAAYRAAYDRLRELERELDDITAHARERAQEADLLRHGLTEIESVAPLPGEGEALSAESSRLGHAESLREAAGEAHTALRTDGDSTSDLDAIALVSAARRSLDAQREHDSELGSLADRLADASAVLADIAAELASYTAAVESDPARLAAVEERRAALGGLTRKYGSTVDDVLAWAEQASARLLLLDADDERLEALAAERVALRVRARTPGGRGLGRACRGCRAVRDARDVRARRAGDAARGPRRRPAPPRAPRRPRRPRRRTHRPARVRPVRGRRGRAAALAAHRRAGTSHRQGCERAASSPA